CCRTRSPRRALRLIWKSSPRKWLARPDDFLIVLKQGRSRLDVASRIRKIACMKLWSACWTLAFLLSSSLCPLRLLAASPPIDLPDGFVAEIAAAPPQVKHPIMAALGARGQLFVGDAAGTNLNKAGLEKEMPNR